MGGKSGGGVNTGPSQEYLNKALALQEKMYNQTREDGMPWLNRGQAGINELGRLLGLSGDTGSGGYGSLAQRFTMDDFEASPGYQFRLDEGNKALSRAQAARGNFLSPAAMKEMQKYNQGMASDEFMNSYNRFNTDQGNLYNRLAGVAGMGQQQTGVLANAGQNYANSASNLYGDMANLNMASQVAKNNSRGSMFGNALGLAASTYGGGGWSFSDIRLKEDIKLVGVKDNLNIYEFKYIGEEGRYRGVMAHEIVDEYPKAVSEIDGYLAVDYDQLPIDMEVVDGV